MKSRPLFKVAHQHIAHYTGNEDGKTVSVQKKDPWLTQSADAGYDDAYGDHRQVAGLIIPSPQCEVKSCKYNDSDYERQQCSIPLIRSVVFRAIRFFGKLSGTSPAKPGNKDFRATIF